MIQCEHCGKYTFEKKEKLMLQLIADNDGQLSVAKLAKKIGVSYTYINYYLEPMIGAGLVAKTEVNRSFQTRLLMITPKGLKNL